MQITETSSEGLKRTLKVVVGADELAQRFTTRLGEFKDRVQLKGFRKGHVPVVHLKKVYGRSLMAEVVDEAVRETSTKAIEERKERPALVPAIELPDDKDEIERVMDGKADLAYSMTFEVIPDFTIADLSAIKLERLEADVEPEALDKAISDLLDRSTTFEAEDGRAAGDGDRVTMNFVGKIGGEAFEGGSGEGVNVVIGQGNFIPGFEDGIKGATANDERVIDATFPDDYPVETLAGKAAQFEVKVTEVAKPVRPPVDDEFAKTLGTESLDQLKELITAQIKREYDGVARVKLKRELLDAIDKAHTFELPASLVDKEFEQIWRQLSGSLEKAGKTLSDEGKSEDETREEYRKIAERRVRLGLVIGEFGEKNKVEVTQDELRGALIEQARRYPGQEKAVYEFYEKTPGAIQQLRGPIYEDKVIDFMLAQVKPEVKKVSREELFKQVDDVTQTGVDEV